MKESLTQPKRPFYLLLLNEEMRQPYQKAIAPLAEKTVWFSSFNALLNDFYEEEPAVVIVDLDSLSEPLEIPLQQIRGQFSTSELIAIASSDSSQLALQAIRSGFSDFLLKPVTPEELTWSIQKSQQRQQTVQRLLHDDPRQGLIRAITQISSCGTPTLVQHYTLEYVRTLLQSEGAAWMKTLSSHGKKQYDVTCIAPKNFTAADILRYLPYKHLPSTIKKPGLIRNRKTNTRKVILPCQRYQGDFVFTWGTRELVTAKALSSATMLLEHSELSLFNVHKLKELKKQTFIDDLTGLYNARFLKYAVTNAILNCKDPDQSFSVLFIDVDHFKKINDKYGHLVGSEFLVAIGKTIRNAVRAIDLVFRYGGDEFVVILTGTPTEGAKEIAERIRKNIEMRMFSIQTKRLRTTVSIGLATYPHHAGERETLLKMADQAMYSAKRTSRNMVYLARPNGAIPLRP